ncbi:hypothetical protein DPX39_040065700 [Trypanosoma brucei equiperdum]|uniref:CSC1/OSCA1-like 7TM region domain-containing protein n=1 Tax=Trypanosoma brucei equiperdum TaxID=630700 RepID=A0A3L6L957_9TRYP|nr:hypothetical protein DPX39_040065700 [Trypanosoma brucei equiperdum]
MDPHPTPLNPDATWDDNGLLFTLLMGVFAFIGLGAVSAFTVYAPSMWLRRVFRLNHTAVVLVEEEPLGGDVETLQAPDDKEPRYRRVGCALPYPCSLFVLPSWKCWLSVEEEVEGLENVFKPLVDSESGNPAGIGDNADDRGSAVGDDDETAPLTRDHISSEYPATVEVDIEGVSSGSPVGNVPSRTNSAPKTPLDPHVAVYLYFLKLFSTVFILGSCINLWICVLAGTDDYREKSMVSMDEKHCGAQGSNRTGCMELMPYCHYTDADTCVPVPLHGIYDLTMRNITPNSWRLWFVALLDMAFCLFFIAAIVYYLRKVDKYVETVMRHQMECAVGHRVAIVGGLKGRVLTEAAFRRRYLQEDSYFGPNRRGVNTFRYPVAVANALMGGTLSVDDGDTYHQYDCGGLSCIFSSCFFTRYKTTRSNAVFLQDGSVRRMLFPRDPPPGMYTYMDKTEEAMEGLQEAVADYKVFHKLANHVSYKKRQELHKKLLLVRASFPFCFSMISKVDYWKKAFIERATKLNRFVDEVPARKPKGIAYVVFDNPLAAYEFVNLFYAQHRGASGTWAAIAGPPNGIIEMNITTNRQVGWVRRIVVAVIYILMLLFWSVPVGFLSSIDNISKIPGMGWLSRDSSKLPENVRSAIAALLPVGVLALFNIALPYIVRILAIAMGVINMYEREECALHLQYLFMVLTGVIFQAPLQNGMEELNRLITEISRDSIAKLFVTFVTPKGGYWYTKVVMGLCVSTWVAFLNPGTLTLVVLQHKLANVQRVYNELFGPCLFEWPHLYSFDLSLLAMGLLFHMTVPLLSFFVGIYFVVRYFTQRGMLYDRYRPENHPRQDCTPFGAAGMVIRAACWLYCLGAVGGVLFMNELDHLGGLLICSVSFTLSVILLAYTHITTRRWIATLPNARRLLRNRVPRSVQTQYGTSRSADNVVAPKLPNPKPPARAEEERREADSAVTFQGATLPVVPRKQYSMETLDLAFDGVAGPTHCAPTTSLLWQSRGMQSSPVGSVCNLQDPDGTEMEGVVEWDAAPDAEDDMLYHRMSLLPHNPNVDSRYNPRHQQLQRINITREIERLEETIFHVERYWDAPYSEVNPEECGIIEQR